MPPREEKKVKVRSLSSRLLSLHLSTPGYILVTSLVSMLWMIQIGRYLPVLNQIHLPSHCRSHQPLFYFFPLSDTSSTIYQKPGALTNGFQVLPSANETVMTVDVSGSGNQVAKRGIRSRRCRYPPKVCILNLRESTFCSFSCCSLVSLVMSTLYNSINI